MNLILDIGNTRAKIALFHSGDLIYSEISEYDELIIKLQELELKHKISAAIVSNVGPKVEGLLPYLKSKYFLVALDSNTPLPIKIDYESEKTLGVDRRALSVAAWKVNRGSNSLVIDMGSCITFDFIDSSDVFRGGAISPGAKMRFKAMNQFTASLPLVDLKNSDDIVGKNTEMSLVNGVVNGISGEIDNYISTLSKKYEKISVFITGGEHQFFVNKLKNSIFADPNFLLMGLNVILEYNLKLKNEVL